jgi:hypothetical protein
MHRHTRQEGSALILLLVIMATLAIVSVSLTMVVVNQMGATAMERSSK